MTLHALNLSGGERAMTMNGPGYPASPEFEKDSFVYPRISDGFIRKNPG